MEGYSAKSTSKTLSVGIGRPVAVGTDLNHRFRRLTQIMVWAAWTMDYLKILAQ